MDKLLFYLPNQNRRIILLALIIIILFSLFFSIGMVYELMVELTAWIPLAIFGDTAQVTVTRRSTVESEGIFYQLEFDYCVQDKYGDVEKFSGKLLVSQSFWQSHEAGSSIVIRYLPIYPNLARINGHPYEFNMWLLTFCLYTAFLLQIILIPVAALKVSKNEWIKSLIMILRIGGITMFIVTVLILALEFLVDSLGTNLGIFSGGAIPLLAGIGAGCLVALPIWRNRVNKMDGMSEFSWKELINSIKENKERF